MYGIRYESRDYRHPSPAAPESVAHPTPARSDYFVAAPLPLARHPGQAVLSRSVPFVVIRPGPNRPHTVVDCAKRPLQTAANKATIDRKNVVHTSPH